MADRGPSAHSGFAIARPAGLRKQLVEYLRRLRDREILRSLDRVTRRDILETRITEEAAKPFWKP